MRLASFLLRRFVYSVVVLIGLSILIFVLARIVPGDLAHVPAAQALDVLLPVHPPTIRHARRGRRRC